jgi:sec-independent protein translocase protein TatB
MADTFIIMVIALVVFGPRRLPQIGRQIGKLMYEFRKASNDFKFQMEEELRNAEEADRRKKEEERLRALALAAPAPASADSRVSDAVSPPHGPGPAGGDPGPGEPRVQSTSGMETPKTDAPTAAEGYDNGPIASSQVDTFQAVDAAPTIMPPSIGETVAAARGWNLKHELARQAEHANAATVPTSIANELSAPESSSSAPSPASAESVKSELDTVMSVASQTGSSEPGRSENDPDTTAPAASGAVNHHG